MGRLAGEGISIHYGAPAGFTDGSTAKKWAHYNLNFKRVEGL
jgi:hypothetical protein